jgi:hypothetical protein
MNKTFTTLLSLSVSLFSLAQTQIANGGFENWGGNPSPGVTAEPTGWYSNKSGSSVAKLGPQLCFRDQSIVHSGTSSVRVETLSYFGTAVNGAVTTGVVNAPSTNKAEGYLGTVNYSSSSDIRRTAFTGRPDSIVGWYQYTAGAAAEIGKVTAILHNNQYFDPETPVNSNHADPTADKVARATFLTPTGNSAVWKRFSAPFVYTAAGNPAYIMINITSSANQMTTVTGSKMWVDDISFIYNSVTTVKEQDLEKNTKVYYFDKNIYVDSASDLDQATLEIFNVTGQLISSQKFDNTPSHTMDVSSLKTGIYMYKLSSKNQNKVGKLFID